MARPLPVPDTTELPFDKAADLRRMGFDMGPGNPRVAPGGSPEASSFKSLRYGAPNMGPQPTAAIRTAADASQLGQRVGGALRAAAPAAGAIARVGGAAGVVSNFNDYKINDPDVDSSAMGTLRAIGQGDFQGALRSAGKGLLETGMDLGSSVANTLDYVVPGKAPVSSRYNLALREMFGDQLIDNSGSYPGDDVARSLATPAPVVAGVQQPAAQAVQPFSDARMTAAAPALAAGIGPASVGPVTTGARPLRENSIGTLGFEGYRQMAENIRNLPGSGEVGGIAGIGGGTLSSALREKMDSTSTAFAPSGLDAASNVPVGRGARGGGANPALEAAAAQRREAAETARFNAREAGETARAMLRENGENRRFAESQQTARRGQDVTLAGNRLTVEQAVRSSLRDQGNKDREFNAAQSERDLAAATKSQEAFDKQLEARFRTTDDKGNNVADMGKVAAYKTAMVPTVAALARALQASGTPEAKAKAADLEKRGVAALSPADHDQLQQLFNMRELARQTAGFLPGKSDFVDSDNLLDYMQAREGGVTSGLTGRRVRLANGTTVDLDKLRYGPDGNTVLPNFQPGSTNLTRSLRGLE